MGIKNFTEIKAWQEAKKLAIFAYQLTKKEYFKKDFSLARQLQSSTVSTMANIAEGFGRKSNKVFRYFLKIAQASNIEAQSHIYLARDLNYITNENLNTFINISGSVHRALDAFIYYLNKSS